jgi:hypothetical protein
MLRAGQIQDCVTDGYEEIGSFAAKLPGQRRLAQKLHDVIVDEPPKLPGRNPDVATVTKDFC